MARTGLVHVLGALLGMRSIQRCLATVAECDAEFRALSDAEIVTACTAMVRSPKLPGRRGANLTLAGLLGRDLEDADGRALALAVEAFRRCPPEPLARHTAPYPEQVRAAVNLLRGCLVQMDTGEGKTFAVMMAALALLRRHTQIVIVTANPYLATRDAAKCTPFWSGVGIDVGLILPRQYATPGWPGWEATVVYTTAEMYVFQTMEDDLAMSTRQRELGDPALLLDEVDAILLEKLRGDFETRRYVTSATKDWAEALAVAQQLAPEHVDVTPDGADVILTAAGEQEVRRLLVETPTDDEGYLVMLRDLELSYVATRITSEGHDYRVEGDRLVTLDPLSGWSTPFLTPDWVAPLEQFLGLRRHPERRRIHITNAIDVVRRAAHVAGTSGTVVDEALEYMLLLNLPTAIIPARTRRHEEMLPERMFYDAGYAIEHIAELAAVEAPHRPVLVIAGSTGEAGAIAEAVRERAPEDVEVRRADAETVTGEQMFEDAGEPGIVVCSTRLAGRGVDIQLTDRARAASGTLLIVLGHAEEVRLDRQVLGRVGRGGDPYTAYFLNHLHDPLCRNITIPAHGVLEDTGSEGLPMVRSVSRALRAMQRARRNLRLQRFINDIATGRAKAESHAFLGEWFSLVQASGDHDQCGGETLSVVTTRTAEGLVPELDGRTLQSTQARTVAQRAVELTGDRTIGPDLEVRLPGKARDDAVAALSGVLQHAVTAAAEQNAYLFGGAEEHRLRAATRVQFRKILVEVVDRLTAIVIDGPDVSVRVWAQKELETIVGSPTTSGPLLGDRLEELCDTAGRDGAVAAIRDDAVAAYLRRERVVDACRPGGMRGLEWDVLISVLWNHVADGGRAGSLAADALDLGRIAVGVVLTTDVHHPAPVDHDLGCGVEDDLGISPSAELDTVTYLRRVRVVCRSRTTRRIAQETIVNSVEPYLLDAHRATTAVAARELSSVKYQLASAAAWSDLRIRNEARLVERLYANLVRAGEPDVLDELFASAENSVRFDDSSTPTVVPAPPPRKLTPAARPTIPRERAELILYFVNALDGQEKKPRVERELVTRALQTLLADSSVETLSHPERVREATERWRRSKQRHDSGIRERRALDRCVRMFLDFLFEHGLAAPRPRGLKASTTSVLRRAHGLLTLRSLALAMSGVGLVVLGVLLAELPVRGVSAPLSPAVALLDGIFAGGMLATGQALGFVIAPVTSAAAGMWLIQGLEVRRGAYAGEGLLFWAAAVGLCLWNLLDADPGVGGVALSLGCVGAALLLRNACWVAENFGQVRVIAGVVATFSVLTVWAWFTGPGDDRTVVVVAAALAAAFALSKRLRRATVRVNALVGAQEKGDRLLVSRSRISGRVDWVAFALALVAAWSLDAVLPAGNPASAVATVALYLLVLGWYARRVSVTVTNLETWSRKFRRQQQRFIPSRRSPTLEVRLRRVRARLFAQEMLVASLMVGGSVAALAFLGPVLAPVPSTALAALVLVSLIVFVCDLGAASVQSLAAVLGPSGATIAETGDDDVSLREDVQRVVGRVAKRLSIAIFVFLALKQVADVLSVWEIVVAIWDFVVGLWR